MFEISVLVGSILVLGIGLWAGFWVGVQEANDPEHANPEDLTEVEKHLVERDDVTPKQT